MVHVLVCFAMRFAAALALVLVACSAQPLPADKLDYAGHWRAPGIDLQITAEGRVHYRRSQGAGKVEIEIDGPVAGFDGDDFIVGVMVMKTRFDVTAPPKDVGGYWSMTVDGVELTRD
jgi:hypothetical protein